MTDSGRGELRSVALRLAAGAAALFLVLACAGWLLTKALTPSALTEWDESVSEWFAAARTPTWDALTWWGSHLSETVTCIAVAALAVVVLRARSGRWDEPALVLVAILGELFVFLLVTAVVNRPRPEVLQLDDAPPTSSFPSGHTAAAVALYGAIAYLLWRMLTNRAAAAAVVVVCACIPVVVALSRLYRGMHFPSDVVAGALGGGAWLLITVVVLAPRVRAEPGSRELSTAGAP